LGGKAGGVGVLAGNGGGKADGSDSRCCGGHGGARAMRKLELEFQIRDSLGSQKEHTVGMKGLIA